MFSRRSSRLKDGVVKSLFNKNCHDEDLLCIKTKNIEKSNQEIKTINLPGTHDSKLQDHREECKYATTNGEVLVDLDVNRPLVSQLTPRKKTHSYIERLFETSVERTASNVQATCSALNSCDLSNSKMSESLSNALGLVPNMSSRVNMTNCNEPNLLNYPYSVSDQQSVNITHTPIETVNTLRERNFSGNGIPTMPSDTQDITAKENSNIKENRINRGLCAFDIINEGDTEKVAEEKINELPQKVISSNQKKEIIIKGTNVDEMNQHLDSDELRMTRKKNFSNKEKFPNGPETLKGKQKDQQRMRGLSSLVRRISSHEHDSTTNDKWPSPADIKKAYLELNLVPPSSPNGVT